MTHDDDRLGLRDKRPRTVVLLDRHRLRPRATRQGLRRHHRRLKADRATRRFFVMRSPVVRGFKTHDDAELNQILSLPYLIVNKTRLSYIYDFNEG